MKMLNDHDKLGSDLKQVMESARATMMESTRVNKTETKQEEPSVTAFSVDQSVGLVRAIEDQQ
jgi:hypothetical protein